MLPVFFQDEGQGDEIWQPMAHTKAAVQFLERAWRTIVTVTQNQFDAA